MISTRLYIAAGVAVAIVGAFLAGQWTGGREERAQIEAQAARDALERIEQREKNDASFKRLPLRDRCIAIMRDSGLSDSECD